MSKWVELAERCEKATGPDREIDHEIYKLVGRVSLVDITYLRAHGQLVGHPDFVRVTSDGSIGPTSGMSTGDFILNRYTESLDAITALIDRELPGFYWSAIVRATPLGKHTAEGVISNGELFMTGQHRGWNVFAYTPALALCAAFCRAMNEKEANA